MIYLRIKSRHPSHNDLRNKVEVKNLVLLRLGSITNTKIKWDLILNSIQGIKNSSDKLLMKKIFLNEGIKTCDWWSNESLLPLSKDMLPLIAKHRFGSKGKGNYKLNNIQEIENFLQKRSKDLEMFIFEKYTSFCREYRLHISRRGCFYSCRKLRKKDTLKKDRWKFNNDTCIWYLESNPKFNKPDTWDLIIKDCIKAMNGLGLDICCFDIRVSKEGDWKIIESNSAPSLGEIGIKKYINELKTLTNENNK